MVQSPGGQRCLLVYLGWSCSAVTRQSRMPLSRVQQALAMSRRVECRELRRWGRLAASGHQYPRGGHSDGVRLCCRSPRELEWRLSVGLGQSSTGVLP